MGNQTPPPPQHTQTHTLQWQNKKEENNNKTNVQTSWSRFLIIKWWPEGRGSMMRKHWRAPCSVIKWWPDGVRGREMISTGRCAPGKRNIVRCLKQCGYLWEMSLCKNKDERQIAVELLQLPSKKKWECLHKKKNNTYEHNIEKISHE